MTSGDCQEPVGNVNFDQSMNAGEVDEAAVVGEAPIGLGRPAVIEMYLGSQ